MEVSTSKAGSDAFCVGAMWSYVGIWVMKWFVYLFLMANVDGLSLAESHPALRYPTPYGKQKSARNDIDHITFKCANRSRKIRTPYCLLALVTW